MNTLRRLLPKLIAPTVAIIIAATAEKEPILYLETNRIRTHGSPNNQRLTHSPLYSPAAIRSISRICTYPELVLHNIKQGKSQLPQPYPLLPRQEQKQQQALLKKQDKQSAQLIHRLMNKNETVTFKNIAQEYMQLTELHPKYPELTQHIQTHLEAPGNPQQFVDGLRELAQQEKLPEQFGQAFQVQENKIANMGTIEWALFLYNIRKKF